MPEKKSEAAYLFARYWLQRDEDDSAKAMIAEGLVRGREANEAMRAFRADALKGYDTAVKAGRR